MWLESERESCDSMYNIKIVMRRTVKRLNTAFGHYSSYAKVAELKKTLRVEQFACWKTKQPDHVSLSTRQKFRMSWCSRGSIAGKERRLWERGGRWEGGRGCRTIRSPTSTSVGRRGIEDRVASPWCRLFEYTRVRTTPESFVGYVEV